jgi:hypothetical protein
MGLQFLLHTGDDVDDHDDSRDTRETAPLPLDAQNPEHPATALPFVTMPTLSSNIPSLAEQEAWHYQIVGDSELYGLVEIGRQNERTLRAGMKRHIEQFLSRCSQLDPSIRIKVDQEVDLRSHFLKTNYKDSEFQGISQLSESHDLQSSLSASSGIGRFRLDDDLLYCSTCGDFRSSSLLHSVAVFRCLPSRSDHVRFAAHGETS